MRPKAEALGYQPWATSPDLPVRVDLWLEGRGDNLRTHVSE